MDQKARRESPANVKKRPGATIGCERRTSTACLISSTSAIASTPGQALARLVRGKCTAVNDSTIPVRTLVKVEHRVWTQARELLTKLFQMLTAEYILWFV
jgi:hypothetical protein